VTGFELTAEFHELGMAEPWSRLLPRLRELADRTADGAPRCVLEIGAGSGMGTVGLAGLWPGAELVAVEPDATMRAMLLGRLAADAGLRGRTTVLSLPVAPGTTHTLRERITAAAPSGADLVVLAHMAGLLEPIELRALMEVTAGTLAPGGVAVVTFSTPHGGDGDAEPADAVVRHVEEVAVGHHRVRGVYERTPAGFRVGYEQLDGAGTPLRSVVRSGPAREPAGEEELVAAAAAAGLVPSDLGWLGALVLRRGDAPANGVTEDRGSVAPDLTSWLPDWDDVARAHTERLRALDPALGAVTAPGGDERLDVLRVQDDDGPVWGILRRSITAPGDPVSLWGPATREILQLRSAHRPSSVAFAGLLDRWLLRLRAEGEAGTGDRGAIVRVPDAERALTLPLLEAGFAPQTTTAIRAVRPEEASGPDPAEPGLRAPLPSDRERLLDLAEEMVASDVAAGSAWPRPDARTLVAHYVDELLARPDGWGYVAADESGVVGAISLAPPRESAWAAPSTSLAPVVYLGMTVVAEGARRRGIGRRLVDAAHRRAAAEGASAVLLDHATLSPLSAPFWHRRGYRPLWTTWVRRL